MLDPPAEIFFHLRPWLEYLNPIANYTSERKYNFKINSLLNYFILIRRKK